MSAQVAETGSYANITGSGQVGKGPLQLIGFFVNTTSSGTIAFADGATTVSGTITPAAGAFYRFPCAFGTSCQVTIGATINVTLFYIPSQQA